MAAKVNSKGLTWRQHAGPYLSQALRAASRSWKPRSKRTNKKRVIHLRHQRTKINAEIKHELEKG